MRVLRPDLEGFVGRDGTRVHYEVFGAGERTLMLLPPWSIVSSRHWKFQVPYLARHFRVVTFDGRGNGLSDRDRKSTCLNSSHITISYAVFCLKKKTQKK